MMAMSTLTKNKVAIFDFDGVLVESTGFWEEIMASTTKALKFNESYIEKISGKAFFYGIFSVKKFLSPRHLIFLLNICKKINQYYKQLKIRDDIKCLLQTLHKTHDIVIYSLSPKSIIMDCLKRNDLLQYVNRVITARIKKSKDFISITKNYSDSVYIDDKLTEAKKSCGIVKRIYVKHLHDRYEDNIIYIKEVRDAKFE